MSNFEQEAYHDKVMSTFAEGIYKKMATKRYGIEFCCDTPEQIIIKQERVERETELLQLNAIADPIDDDGEIDGEPVGVVILCVVLNVNFFAGEPGTLTYVSCEGEAVAEEQLTGNRFDRGVVGCAQVNSWAVTGVTELSTGFECYSESNGR